jgi:hypothetical protein
MFRTGWEVPVEYKLANCAFSFWDGYHSGVIISVHSGVITILIMMMTGTAYWPDLHIKPRSRVIDLGSNHFC